MSQLTVQLDENAEVAIEELKKLLGTERVNDFGTPGVISLVSKRV